MRWHALGVDYEMSGKDLIDSVRLSGKICRILGSEPPAGFTYELFLDEQAQKISKSRGNGLSVEEWLRYAPPESLAQFMFNQPQRAKRLYFDVIPRAVDEYLANAARAHGQAEADRPVNPAWHIHAGSVPQDSALAAVVRHAAEPGQRGERRDARHPVGLHPPLQPGTPRPRTCRSWPGWWNTRSPTIAISCARPKQFRDRGTRPSGRRWPNWRTALRALPPEADGETIQTAIYEVGKRHPFADLRAWFGCLYQVLLGQQEGPRFGQFVALYGIAETIALIEDALARPPSCRPA